ncbi:hypothetical protein GCK32_003243 [Trichostrongylus colubriformis]|uniref:Uncharacterized protein n=1 Tax=Trichostrongylus colubriformis TaxID=6319 RepID=A0AAN8F3C5_TRICO
MPTTLKYYIPFFCQWKALFLECLWWQCHATSWERSSPKKRQLKQFNVGRSKHIKEVAVEEGFHFSKKFVGEAHCIHGSFLALLLQRVVIFVQIPRH